MADVTTCALPGCTGTVEPDAWICSRGHEQAVIEHVTRADAVRRFDEEGSAAKTAGVTVERTEPAGWTCDAPGCGMTNAPSDSSCAWCGATAADPPASYTAVVFPDGRRILLAPGEHLRLGRGEGWSPIARWFDAYPNVSRCHATLVLDDEGLAVIDGDAEGRASTNGTFVNGGPPLPACTRTSLRPGDEVRLAAHLMLRIQQGGTP